jgi:hypothetical protein
MLQMIQIMQMSMLQHNQYMEEERKCQGEECKDQLALQQMLVTSVGRAVAAMNKYTNNEEEEKYSIKFL